MKTPDGNTIYYCVVKDKKTMYTFRHNGSDAELKNNVDLCIQNMPPLHKWYTHTVNTKTFGFLMDEDHTYIAIVDPTPGYTEIIAFLKQIRDKIIHVSKKHWDNELKSATKALLVSLESVPRSNSAAKNIFLFGASGDMRPTLVHRTRSGGVDENGIVEARTIDVPSDDPGQTPSDRSSTDSRLQQRASRKHEWRRWVGILSIINVVLIVVLLAIWLGLCQGGQCLR